MRDEILVKLHQNFVFEAQKSQIFLQKSQKFAKIRFNMFDFDGSGSVELSEVLVGLKKNSPNFRVSREMRAKITVYNPILDEF